MSDRGNLVRWISKSSGRPLPSSRICSVEVTPPPRFKPIRTVPCASPRKASEGVGDQFIDDQEAGDGQSDIVDLDPVLDLRLRECRCRFVRGRRVELVDGEGPVGEGHPRRLHETGAQDRYRSARFRRKDLPYRGHGGRPFCPPSRSRS